MAYISNPVYRGVGAVDTTDKVSALVRSAQFNDTYTQAFKALASMSPEQVDAVARRVRLTVQQLPSDKQQQVVATANLATQTLDTRRARGLGDPLSAAANIAGIIASLGALTIGTVSFVDARNKTKADQARQDKIDKQNEQAAQAQINANKQTLAAQQQQTQLDAAGMTIDAQGNIVKKSNPLATAGALAAAVTGAFLLTK